VINDFWVLGLGLGFIVVTIVVILLVGIIFQTKRIIRLAGIALNEVKQIEDNTLSIWKLKQTNIQTEKISDGFEKLEEHLINSSKKEKIKEAS
jgi:hypothetical protein|tara:strand:+ start:7231 stop:7509 length:279 start_codon:yes stop_codon:yes gene_type:complete